MNYHSNPTEIEHELGATRARLDRHLDELTRRLSPGQLLDEGLSYLRTGQGADFVRNLGAEVRQNPLPVTLAGFGLAWLAASSTMRPRPSQSRALVPYDEAAIAQQRNAAAMAERARQAARSLSRHADETEDAFRERVAEAQAKVLSVTRQVQETAADFVRRVEQAMQHAQHSARDGLDRWRDTAATWSESAASGMRKAGEAANSVVNASADAASDVLGGGRDAASRAGDLAGRAAQAGAGIGAALTESPVLLAAISMTAGALLGALLPASRMEREYMRDATTDLAATAQDVARDALHRGARVAGAAMDAGYRAAREEGITPGASRVDGGTPPDSGVPGLDTGEHGAMVG